MSITFREMLKKLLPELKKASDDKFTVEYYQEQMNKHRSKQAKIKSLCETVLDQLLLWGIYGQYDDRKLQQSELNIAVCIFKKCLSKKRLNINDIDLGVESAVTKIATRAYGKYEIFCTSENVYKTAKTVTKILKSDAIKLFR